MSSVSHLRLWPLAGAMVLLSVSSLSMAAPQVLTSIKPLHSLASAVMQGVGEPKLLLSGASSPHDYSLKPSQARDISQAQVVFWIGPALEGFLAKPLANAKTVRSVELSELPQLQRLPIREGGVWAKHSHSHDHDHDEHENFDAHLWLDPDNAKLIAQQMAQVLAELDPAHATQYQQNAAQLQQQLTALDQELQQLLEPVRTQPYIVFHDAYQYFEQHYQLNAVGSITLNPEQKPGAQRVQSLRQTITERQAQCVFSEPQFKPDLVNTLIEGSSARSAVLDPLGSELPANAQAYEQLLRNLATSLRNCLSKS